MDDDVPVETTYRLVVGITVVVDARDGDLALELVQGTGQQSVELLTPERANAQPGEVEVHVVYEFLNPSPQSDRLDSLREGTLLAGVGTVTGALRAGGVPCEVSAWGCRDPQLDDRF